MLLACEFDLMSSLRGLPPFAELWQRRTTIESGGERVDILSLEDLVKAKKTQRDKDWPMVRRLVEQSYFATPVAASRISPHRIVVQEALAGGLTEVARALDEEEKRSANGTGFIGSRSSVSLKNSGGKKASELVPASAGYR